MAMETVEIVRRAELSAAQMEKDALLKKENIISDASVNAKNLISTRTEQAMLDAEVKIAAANKLAENILDTAKQKAEREVLNMQKSVLDKEQAAVEQVLNSIIY
jgi:hypothetical protein